MKVIILGKYDYQTFPINREYIEVDESILNRIGKDLKFDVENKTIGMMSKLEIEEMNPSENN